jgi:hypothetical protein
MPTYFLFMKILEAKNIKQFANSLRIRESFVEAMNSHMYRVVDRTNPEQLDSQEPEKPIIIEKFYIQKKKPIFRL